MEILVFTYGDSLDISTWSNVPFLFTKTLEEKGHTIHRVDISPNKTLEHLYNTLSFYIFKRILKRKTSCPIFIMTKMHRILAYRKIKKATKRYPNIHLSLFLTYHFYNKYSNKPSILWHDWSNRAYIERTNRKPYAHEIKALESEDLAIKKACRVYTMFPSYKELMETLHMRKFIYLNRNVVNTVYDKNFDIQKNISAREKSNIILFIGNLHYMEAAKELTAAFMKLKEEDDKLELHLIGISDEQFPTAHDGIHCHGYLRKNIKKERDLYYKLLTSCKVFVNPAKKWGGYSSSIEAMYYGCPLIISPYDDFVKEFGEEIDFGVYFKEGSLIECIKRVIYSDKTSYIKLCNNSHKRVADYSWSNYVNDFLESLTDLNIE